MRLLVVDDDVLLCGFVREVLQEEGYAVDVAHDAASGRSMALTYDYDGIVMDFVLPDATGVDVVRELRRRGHPVPVLMLTARGGSDDQILGLDAGADDYLPKPFEVGVLKARVRALVRRAGASRGEALEVGDVAVDRLTRTVVAAGTRLRLTPKEFSLLEHFLLRPGRIVSRTELLEKVWDIQFDPGSNVVDVHVARLRAKLLRARSRARIETVRGAGFLLSADGALTRPL
ncbi:MAG: two component transcriptional regulator, winged helix family [Gemmatimonadetes bacterium]|nr:two component transcriptional regulator, winged helix family [Gemmatimonadota bacterium]